MGREESKFKFDKELIIALDEEGHFAGFFNNLADIDVCEYKKAIDKILVYELKAKFKFFMKMEALEDE